MKKKRINADGVVQVDPNLIRKGWESLTVMALEKALRLVKSEDVIEVGAILKLATVAGMAYDKYLAGKR